MNNDIYNKEKFDPAQPLQDFLVFGEFGDVNPSITDSSTYTFLSPDKMQELFEHDIEGCFLYSRHWNPINRYLSRALAGMEGTENAIVTSSGMAAISSTILQFCGSGDEVVAGRTIYGGTYALFKNFLPRFGITSKFVNTADVSAIEAAITPQTKIIYCESVSNPLLEVANIPEISKLAKKHNLMLVVDNTFSPLTMSPHILGADVVIHSLTKFINGTSDCVAGCICASNDIINKLTDINAGASMLLGPVLDSYRAASILKNLHSLHIRITQHSRNAQYISEQLEKNGIKVYYPGLPSHKQHDVISNLMNKQFGYGGMLIIDTGSAENANKLMQEMQNNKVGYLAVSLGYFKTLFSAPGSSTSSEIPEEDRRAMGLNDGFVRFSVGLDNNIELSFSRIQQSLKAAGLVK